MLAVSLAASRPAHAGIIRGRVALDRSSYQPGVIAQPEPGVTEAVVFVDAVPQHEETRMARGRTWFIFRSAETRPLRVVQADLRFKPRVLVTPLGRPVEFKNLDHVYHNAFSVSAAKHFDLGKNPPGRSDTVSFERPGIINVHCDIHPQEMGYIVVTPNHFMARPDAYGRYELPKLPPGHYTVCAWHPRHGEIRRPVQIPKHGDVVLDIGF